VTYYLGALGALAALPDPEAGLSLTPERIGSPHQLLSGAKVRDTIGYSRQWQLSWTAITLAQYGLLEGFYYGFTGGGPYYFVDDEQTNLLPLNVSTGTDTTGATTGAVAGSNVALFSSTGAATSWNSLGGPFPANGTLTLGHNLSTSVVAGNVISKLASAVPVVAGATYTASVYVSTPAFTRAWVFVQWLNGSGAVVSTITGNAVAVSTNARTLIAGVAPATAVTAQVGLQVESANTTGSAQFLYSDGWQFEMNGAASSWQPGIPVPLVTVESLSRSTPLAGICDAQMTLVQVG